MRLRASPASFTSAFGADGAGAVTYAARHRRAWRRQRPHRCCDRSVDCLVNNGGRDRRPCRHCCRRACRSRSASMRRATSRSTRSARLCTERPDPNDSVTLSADNLVVLTATVTDKDGDHTSAGLNIGHNLNFHDDGPSVSLAAVTEPTLTVDETVLATNATASFAGSSPRPSVRMAQDRSPTPWAPVLRCEQRSGRYGDWLGDCPRPERRRG